MKDNATQKRTVNNEQEKQHSLCECCNKYSKSYLWISTKSSNYWWF